MAGGCGPEGTGTAGSDTSGALLRTQGRAVHRAGQGASDGSIVAVRCRGPGAVAGHQHDCGDRLAAVDLKGAQRSTSGTAAVQT